MQCTYKKTNGIRCGANAMKNSKYCFTHNPKTKDKHALAVVKGGQMSRRDRLSLDPVTAKTPNDVVNLLQETINGIRSGEVPPNIANTIGYLCGHLLKAIESSDLDKRMEIIEQVILQRKTVMRRNK